jgi:hypothetical protein
MAKDPFQTGLNALANSSRVPVGRSELLAILSTGDGSGNLVRALFGDCSLESLEKMAMQAGITTEQLRSAYRLARARHSARNLAMEVHEPLF